MADKLAAILARLEPDVRRAFEEAIADLRSAAQLHAVIGHIEAGNIEAALIALNLRTEFFAPLDDALYRAFNAGGVSALAGLRGDVELTHDESGAVLTLDYELSC